MVRMRLTLSLLAAIGLHGALFGVTAALLAPAPGKAEVAPAIDVEVIAPRPEPIADSPTGPAPARASTPTPPRPHVRHVRQVAVGDSSTTALADLRAAAAARVVSTSTPPVTVSSPSVSAAPAMGQGRGAKIAAQPRYHTNPKPEYPIPSLRRREEGIVLLNVQVQSDGTPAGIALNRSCGHPLLDRAALAAVRRWIFEPARAAGIPVSSLVVIPVRFSLSGQQ
jgi:periplasmic protein TonB